MRTDNEYEFAICYRIFFTEQYNIEIFAFDPSKIAVKILFKKYDIILA